MLIKELMEMAAAHKFSSGMFKSQDAKALVKAFKAGEETYDLDNGRKFKFEKNINGSKLAKGMVVIASYNKYNQGAELVEILGVTDDDVAHGEGGVKFPSVEAFLKAKGLKSLKDHDAHAEEKKLPYGHHPNLVVKDLKDGDEGPWYYPSEGRWVRGSGAEPLSFALVSEVKGGEKKEVKEAREPITMDTKTNGPEQSDMTKFLKKETGVKVYFDGSDLVDAKSSETILRNAFGPTRTMARLVDAIKRFKPDEE
jgi:hypothetical protein